MPEKISSLYKDVVQQIKLAILQSQQRALYAVNQEQLLLYYSIGRYVSHNSRHGSWGKNAIETISDQLKLEMPGLRGFSPTNIKKMRQFYEQWFSLIESESTLNESQDVDNQKEQSLNLLSLSNRPPLAGDFDWVAFLSISFSHHSEILSKTQTLEERLFYIQKSASLHWDKYTLRDNLNNDLYHHQGSLPNNFVKTITDSKLAFRSIAAFKDEYLLDFINVESFGERDEDIDERVLENEIVHNVKNFILTFGKSFSFIGNQVHLDKFGHDHWVDLLFFNRELKALVVVELKKGTFKPAYLGQLATYLRILDDDQRLAGENPSVGIVLCKDADKAYVEYVLQDYNKPMGVATYKVTQQKLSELLPDEDELKKLL